MTTRWKHRIALGSWHPAWENKFYYVVLHRWVILRRTLVMLKTAIRSAWTVSLDDADFKFRLVLVFSGEISLYESLIWV
jgi:hypothetical protein